MCHIPICPVIRKLDVSSPGTFHTGLDMSDSLITHADEYLRGRFSAPSHDLIHHNDPKPESGIHPAMVG